MIETYSLSLWNVRCGLITLKPLTTLWIEPDIWPNPSERIQGDVLFQSSDHPILGLSTAIASKACVLNTTSIIKWWRNKPQLF